MSIATFAMQMARQASEGERNASGIWNKPDRLQAASRHITPLCYIICYFFQKEETLLITLMAKMMLVKTECKQAKNKLKYIVLYTAVLSSAFTMSACSEFLLWSPMP